MHIKKQRLLTPGPTPLYPPALHAMMASDLHHRTEDFRKVYQACVSDLKEVLATSYDVVPLVASGSGAMEASVSNLFSKGDKVIVCVAGKFGERWEGITKAYGLEQVVLREEYGGAVSAQSVAAALAANPDAKGVFIQASETSTGAAHDIEAIARHVAATGAILVVDGITGVGTQPLKIEEWGIDVLIGGSQKAFMIPPGLAFLAISPKAWARADASDLPKYYFNLKKEAKNAAAGESSWTPATSLMLALAEALKYIKSIGMDKLIDNAQLLAKATREAAAALGLELFSPGSPGSAVTAIKAPAGMDSGVIVKGFKQRFGAIIANGQGSMKGQIFRIAHLGYFDFADLFAMVAALELLLISNGHPVTLGAGVTAVQRVYAEAAGIKV
ncbi:MAG: alanine--glyoxylate aminotransferase family protein [Acidobacteria bacterium]|nr:alanine--glyoxylate aminotransferase family protein [Acidobacteriota bacterium]